MKARLLVPCRGLNPDYDPSNPEGKRKIVLPAGTEIEDPDAWMLCVPERLPIVKARKFTGKFVDGPTRAEPADDECRQTLCRKAPAVARQFGLMEDSEQEERPRTRVTLPGKKVRGNGGTKATKGTKATEETGGR